MKKIQFNELEEMEEKVLNGHVGDFWTGVGIGVGIAVGVITIT
ncbi:hypothetical protein [Carnobacterium divergens]|nr:hypothetical protein [Carnobacterium divergens]